jgi:hypothetical protein
MMPSTEAHETPTPCMEPHHTVAQVAQRWNVSADTIRSIFEREPGVLVIANQTSRGKRRYRTLLIPESVLQRVHRRLENPLNPRQVV